MRRPWLAAPLLAAVTACNCNPKTRNASAQLQLRPSTVDFGTACVQPADPALRVEPTVQSVSFENPGQAPLDLATVEVDGGAAFQVGSDWPRELAAGQSYALPVSFLPTAPGPTSAALVITDTTGQVVTASLKGTGSARSANPVVLLHCPGGQSGVDQCYDPANQATSANPLMWLPDAVAGDSSTLDLWVSNTGCADLVVGAVGLDGGQAGAFALLDDAGLPVPPGAYPPFTLAGNGADAGAARVTVRFSPGDAGVFSDAVLTLSTNIPGATSLAVHLLGSGVAPSLELCAGIGSGTQCAAPTQPLTCDYSANPACTGAFTLHNAGQASLTVDTLRLTEGNVHFALSGVPTLPFTLGPTGSGTDTLSFSIEYAPSAGFESDRLVVHSNGGYLQAIVQGGQPPQLVIVPAAGDLPDTVDFNRDASGNPVSLPNGFTGAKTFQIENLGTGTLIVEKVSFSDTGTGGWPSGANPPIFSLAGPDAGTQVAPNGGVPVVVQYTDPSTGGPSGTAPFATSIRIDSNDPLWPPSAGGKQVTASAKTPCNPGPVAEVSGPSTASAGASVALDGSRSYSVKPDGTGSCQPGIACTASPPVSGCPANPISHWEWTLQTVPTNAGASVALSPNGLTTSPTARLQLGNCSPCSYVVQLRVYDQTPPTASAPNGLPSAPTSFTINVP